MLILCGASNTGKDTIANILVTGYDYNRVVTYTTRPPRENEIQDKDYHFISLDEFLAMKDNGDFLETTKYATTQGTWFYGTAKKDFENADKRSILIMNPDGVKAVHGCENTFIVEIKAPGKTRRIRAARRGDDQDEILRRFRADEHDFRDIDDYTDYYYWNSKGTDLDQLAYMINREYEYRMKTADEPPRILYLDFDNTLVNTAKRITDMYNEDYKAYSGFKHVNWWDIDTWEFKELDIASHDDIMTYFNSGRFFNNKLEFMDNADQLVDEVTDLFSSVHFISIGEEPNLRLKEDWLDEHLLLTGFSDFIGLHPDEDKSTVSMAGAVLVDDRSEILRNSNAKYKICFGDVYSWNADWDGKRCYNWTELYRYLKELTKGGYKNASITP